MHVTVTTRVEVVNEVGKHIVTVERTRDKDAGGNPRFFISEAMAFAQENTEEAIVTAARGIDKSAVTERLDARDE